MKSLVETNAYLSRPAARRRMLAHNALESSIFEGASGLRAKKATEAATAVKAAKAKDYTVHSKARGPLSKAAAKKAVKGS
jgi:hypothetical protein